VIAVIVVSVMLLAAVGVLVSLLRARMNDETVTDRPEVARDDAGPAVSTSVAEPDATPRRSDARAQEDDAAVEDASPETSPATDGGSVPGGDGGVGDAPALTYDFGSPRPEGELARVLVALTDGVRRCTELSEGYRPRTLSVHLIGSTEYRSRVSAIEPEPPMVVGTCISSLVHQATSSAPAPRGRVVQMYELE